MVYSLSVTRALRKVSFWVNIVFYSCNTQCGRSPGGIGARQRAPIPERPDTTLRIVNLIQNSDIIHPAATIFSLPLHYKYHSAPPTRRMSTFRHTIQTLITVFATITCSSGAAAATPYPELDSVICTLMRRYDLPAASIALMRDDRIIYTAAYGVTDTLRHTRRPYAHVSA